MLKRDTVVPEYISCSPLRIHKNGMQSVFITHSGKPLVFQTDTVRLTLNENDIKVVCSDELMYTLRSIDATILEHARQRSKEWFGKELDPDAVLKLFRESVVNNVLNANIIDTDVFDRQKNVKDMSYVNENCASIIVLQLIGVYFAKKRFGASWNVKQILASPSKKLDVYAFDDDEIVPIV
tara:strand:+ start:9521 stop:10063 length:543 start_codon:yes stop_codon:yes gene_type:complete